jgi:hypothetical protein
VSTRRARHLVSAYAAAAIAALTGCADPYARATAPAVPGEQHLTAARSSPLPRRRSPSPDAAARRAAQLALTWTARTYASRQLQFAAEAIGEARRDAELAAGEAGHGRPPIERARSRVVAVRTLSVSPRRDRLVVLMRERRSMAARTSVRWRVIEADVVRVAGGWSVTRWTPQP